MQEMTHMFFLVFDKDMFPLPVIKCMSNKITTRIAY